MVDAYDVVTKYQNDSTSVTESEYQAALSTLGVSTTTDANSAVRIAGSNAKITLMVQPLKIQPITFQSMV